MATAMCSHPSVASRGMAGIRVVLCEPDNSARASLNNVIEADPLLVIVAECGDWPTCALEVEELVPELLIARAGLVPPEWGAQDAFAPVILRLREPAAVATIPFPSTDLLLATDTVAVRQALNRAVSEVYDRKAKQLLYLVQRYVAASAAAAAHPAILYAEHDGREVQVPVSSVLAVLAARKSTVLQTLRGRMMLREPIHRMVEKLDPATFLRIHRSVIINCNHLDREALTRHASHVVLRDGSRYPVGRNYRESLTSFLLRER
jgi:two-component system, LytTR family, response regulator